jgi:hypothetical protein
MYLLGDYAIATPTETFMRKNGDQYTNDIARLRGTRFVTTTEAEQGRRLSEPLIKKITGNDQMTARFLYGEFFNFTPTFKIFMATNHKPAINIAETTLYNSYINLDKLSIICKLQIWRLNYGVRDLLPDKQQRRNRKLNYYTTKNCGYEVCPKT